MAEDQIVELVQTKIYSIRNQKVMLDRDIAELYGVETKRVNEAVRNNADKFPKDFYFEPPMATSKCPTCGRVKMPHPGDGFQCTNVEGKGPYYFLFHPVFWVCVGIAGQRPL